MTENRESNSNRYEWSEEGEINILDLFITLLKYKWMIFFIVVISGVAAVTYSLMATEIFRSQCTIVPIEQEQASLGSRLSALGGFGAMIASQVGIGGAGSLEKFEVVLKSRELTNEIIKKHKLMPIIFKDSWDKDKKAWKEEPPPTFQDAYKEIQEILEINSNKKNNVLTLGFFFPDPAVAQKMLTYYVEGMSEFLRQQSLENVVLQRETLEKQLDNTVDPLLRAKLAEIIAQYVEKEVLAKVQRYYGFNIIDPPFVPEKKCKPKRAQICVLSVVVAFFMAVFLAFILEYLANVKQNEDPERLASLKRYIKIWNR